MVDHGNKVFNFPKPVVDKYEVCGQSGKLEYLPSKCIGIGSNATTVHKGRLEGDPVAVKLIPKCIFTGISDKLLNLHIDENDLNEAKILRQYEHKNVIRYYLLDHDVRFIYLALKLCEGNLAEYFEFGKPEKLPSDVDQRLTVKKHLLQGILEGLNYLHGEDIIHGDLKPANILLQFNKSSASARSQNVIRCDAIISDFGLSLKIDPGRRSKTAIDHVIGTEGWRPKEVVDKMEEIQKRNVSNVDEENESKLKGTKDVDIFALGCMIQYEMAEKVDSNSRVWYMHPFGDDAFRNRNIKRGSRSAYLSKKYNKVLDEVLADMLISVCIDENPECRPDTQEINKHPFFWEPATRYQFCEKVANDVKSLEAKDLRRELNERWKKYHWWNYKKEIPTAFEYFKKYHELQSGVDFNESRGFYLDSLLRDIRNMKQHYQDIRNKDGYQMEIASDLHEGSEEDFDRYFLQKIVQILPVVYTCFYKIPRDSLKAYKAYIGSDIEPALINLREAKYWNTLDAIYPNYDNSSNQGEQRKRHRSGTPPRGGRRV